MPSSIEWTDDTWNPIVGCRRISHGCDHCYAVTMATRIAGMKKSPRPHYQGVVERGDWTGVVNEAPAHIFNAPLKARKPKVWFVNSMSDLFHEAVDDGIILRVFEVMNRSPKHVFQVLTKRPSRMVKKTDELGLRWTDNIWAGTSIESDKFAVPRSREIMKVPALIRFVSAEPLLNALPSLPIDELDWVIAGGESGKSKTVRPCDPDWLRDLRDRCRTAGVPFFFKQWGSHDANGAKVGKEMAGHLLDGEEIFEMPAAAYAQLPSPDPKWVPVAERERVFQHGAMPRPAQRARAATPLITGGVPVHDKGEAVMVQLVSSQVVETASNPQSPEKLYSAGEVERLRRRIEAFKLQPAERRSSDDVAAADDENPTTFLDLVGEE